MTQVPPPIMPKGFAAFIHPLDPKKNYTRGSDGKAGLSQNEAKILRNEIASSQAMNASEKKDANQRVDQALAMTAAAKAQGGTVDQKTLESMLALGKHELDFQPLNQGNAAPKLNFADAPTDHGSLKTEFFKVAAGTCYAPKNTRMQGGPKDSMGKALAPHTLEQYLNNIKKGDASPGKYVAIAMDVNLYRGKDAPFQYGDIFRIPELEKMHNVAPIYFALVDNGGAFRGTGGAKVDICSDNERNYYLNQSLSLHKVLKPSGEQLNAKDLK